MLVPRGWPNARPRRGRPGSAPLSVLASRSSFSPPPPGAGEQVGTTGAGAWGASQARGAITRSSELDEEGESELDLFGPPHAPLQGFYAV